MATLSLTQFLSLDGVHQGPGGPDEDRRDGFDLGGWVFPYFDEGFDTFMDEVFRRPTAFLLGRHTYEIFAGYWPKQTDPDNLIARQLNALPKYVVSTTLTDADWPTTTVLGDAVADVTALKERLDGEIQLHGSALLARTLLDHDLIDTLNLITVPVVLGKGYRFFAEGATPTAFSLSHSRPTRSGVTIQTYERVGRPKFGTFD
ncbi:dihydrofolate reductase family protein [Streptomyces sp. NPDC090025]|uniref:dihydrofolate reductase family protein n=1 Tax=Streptomyces sp. NPDC090025 TaxID=3365922 RepID=UPI00383442E2